MPSSRSRQMISWMLSIVTGSIPVKGSSRRIILGLETNDRAISSRRRSPPERDIPSDLRRCVMLNCSRSSSTPCRALARHPQEFHDAQKVVLDSEFAEDARLLGQISHPALMGPAVHRPMRHITAAQPDCAGVRFDHSASHAETRGFARAVGTQEDDNLASIHLEAHSVDDLSAPIHLDQSMCFQHVRASLRLKNT